MEFKKKIKSEKQCDLWVSVCPICSSKWSVQLRQAVAFELIAFCEHLSHAEHDDNGDVVFVIVRKDGRFWRRTFEGF